MRTLLLLLFAASALLLHSCNALLLQNSFSHNLSVSALSDTTKPLAIAEFPVDDFEIADSKTSFSKEAGMVRVDEHHVLLATQSASATGILALYDDSLHTVWKTQYNTDEEEYNPYVWYGGGIVNVLSLSFGDFWSDSCRVVARTFENKTGALQSTRSLFAVEDKFGTMQLYRSPNSSLLLGVFAGSNVDEDTIATMLVLQPDFAIVQQTAFPVEDMPDEFVFTDKGDIVYASYSARDSALVFSVTRLPLHATQWDTLSVQTRLFTDDEDEITPDDYKLQLCADGTFLLAWSLENDDEAVSMHVSRFDFRAHTASTLADIAFDEARSMALFLEEELEYPQIFDVAPLGDGGCVLLCGKSKPIESGGGGGMMMGGGSMGMPGGGSISLPSYHTIGTGRYFTGAYKNEGFAAICINSDGSVRWQKAENRLYRGALLSAMSSSVLEGNALRTIVLDGGVPLDILFSLADGASSVAAVRIENIDYDAACFPTLTAWNKEYATLILLGEEHGYLARMPFHRPQR